jgi:hypothetical protein
MQVVIYARSGLTRSDTQVNRTNHSLHCNIHFPKVGERTRITITYKILSLLIKLHKLASILVHYTLNNDVVFVRFVNTHALSLFNVAAIFEGVFAPRY